MILLISEKLNLKVLIISVHQHEWVQIVTILQILSAKKRFSSFSFKLN